jgi:hypothetical protein
VRDLNGGKIIAKETAGWLQEAGAEQVQVITDLIQAKGDDDPFSLDVLRYYITIVRGVTPALLKMGLIDQIEYNEILESVFQVGKTSRAQLPFIHTLVRKPLI